MERYSYEASDTFLNVATIPISDHPGQEFHALPYWSSKLADLQRVGAVAQKSRKNPWYL